MSLSHELSLAHFRHYVLTALSDRADDEELERAQIYALPELPQALVAEFELRDAPTQILAFLPAPDSRSEQARQRLSEALRGLQGLKPLSDAPMREIVLDGLLRALDGESEGLLRCTLPPAQPAPDAAAEQIEGRALFAHLAREILSGQVLPQGSSRGGDAFEVYAYVGDEHSTLILRSFDAGRAFALVGGSSHEGCECVPFTQAAQALLERRLNQIPSLEGARGDLTLLRTLSAEEADERLTALAELDHLQGAAYTQGALFGAPSARTREVFRQLKGEVSTEAGPARPVLGQPNLFSLALESLQEADGAPLWSAELEEAGLSRVEILTHRAFPETLLAVAHLPMDAELGGGWALFVPQGDPLVIAQIRADLTRMVQERGLFDTLSLPLSSRSPFIRVTSERVEPRLAAAVAAIANQEGQLLEQLAGKRAQTPRPSAAWLLMQAEEGGQRLH